MRRRCDRLKSTSNSVVAIENDTTTEMPVFKTSQLDRRVVRLDDLREDSKEEEDDGMFEVEEEDREGDELSDEFQVTDDKKGLLSSSSVSESSGDDNF